MNTQRENIIDVLCNAIDKRRLIKFYYESNSSKKKEWRIIEPYIVGVKDKGAGNVFVTGLPKAELSKNIADRITGHYLIDKLDITKLEVLNETFEIPKVERIRITDTPTIRVICRFRYEDET